MNKFIPLLIGGALMIGTLGCTSASTNTNVPDAAKKENQAPSKQTAQQDQGDATNETRKKQLESDIRSREQRNEVAGSTTSRTDGDLESEIRSKLEANLPASQITVDAKDGVVTIKGTVPTPEQRSKVKSLAMEIKGAKSIVDKTTVAAAKNGGKS
jgi:hyperosmotically inducible periplasmic protein